MPTPLPMGTPAAYAQATQLLTEAFEYLLRLPAVPTTVALARKLDAHLKSGAHQLAVEEGQRQRQITTQAEAHSKTPTVALLDLELFQDQVRLSMPPVSSLRKAHDQEQLLVARLRRPAGETLLLEWKQGQAR